ncbi:MAG: A24 family peptidase [Phycisphaeraceae bacterium]
MSHETANQSDAIGAPPAGDQASASPPVPAWQWSSDWTTLWVLTLSLAAAIGSAAQLATAETQHGFFLAAVLIAVCFVAAWYDAATGRVPNMLTYPAFLLGLAVNLIAALLTAAGVTIFARWAGSVDMGASLAGAGVCLAIGITCMIAGGLGGGDVKLMAAIGAIVGFDATLAILFNTLVIASVIALINLIAAGRLTEFMRLAAYNALTLWVLRRRIPFEQPQKHTIPLAVPILLAVVAARFGVGYETIMEWSAP